MLGYQQMSTQLLEEQSNFEEVTGDSEKSTKSRLETFMGIKANQIDRIQR